MRISDWSSDVCSSDLVRGAPHPRPAELRRTLPRRHRPRDPECLIGKRLIRPSAGCQPALILYQIFAANLPCMTMETTHAEPEAAERPVARPVARQGTFWRNLSGPLTGPGELRLFGRPRLQLAHAQGGRHIRPARRQAPQKS